MNYLFKEELTLKRISAVTIVAPLWEEPQIKGKIEECINNTNNYISVKLLTNYIKTSVIEEWLDVSKSTLIKLEPLIQCLPGSLKTQVEDMLLEICEKIFDWRTYLTHTLFLKPDCLIGGDVEDNKVYSTNTLDVPLRNIYWTSHGNVDENKVLLKTHDRINLTHMYFSSFYDGEMEPFLHLLLPKHKLACIHTNEKYLFDERVIFFKAVNKYDPELNLDMVDIVFSIMTIVISAFYFRKKSDLYEQLVLQNGLIMLSAEKMLDISVDLHLYKPVVYFWNKMNPDERELYLHQFSERLIKNSVTGKFNYYETRNLPDIFSFFISKMNREQKHNFILKNFPYLFLSMLKRWSYHKHCILLLEQYWDCLTEIDLQRILHGILINFFKTKNVKNHIVNHFILPVLLYLLNKVPKKIKEKVINLTLQKTREVSFNVWAYDLNLLRNLFTNSNILVLELIYCDRDLEDYNRKIFEIAKGERSHCKVYDYFVFINRVFKKVLPLEDKHNEYERNFKILNLWMMRDEFDLVDRYLDLVSKGNPDEIKSQINFVDVSYRCHKFNQVDLSNKFTTWYPNMGYNEASRSFCRDVVFSIWFQRGQNIFGDYSFCNEESTNFLSWFFHGDEMEILNFKTNSLITDDHCIKLCCNFAREYNFESSFNIIDELFKFCSLTQTKVEEIKQILSDNLFWYMDHYQCYEMVLNNLLDWFFKRDINQMI